MPHKFSLPLNEIAARNLVPEKMDDPALCHREHARALAGLRRINWFSGTASRLKTEILQIAAREPRRHWRILDIGCANGEVALALFRLLKGQLEFTLTGWDRSAWAIGEAQKKAKIELAGGGVQAKVDVRSRSTEEYTGTSLQFDVRDLFECVQEPLAGKLDSQPFDIVYCSLLLHHFTDDDGIRAMSTMARLAQTAILVDDLRRSRLGLLLAFFACHLLSRSPVVHFDGPQSVRAALTCEEAAAMAAAAGLTGVTVRRRWPQRFMLRWEASR